MTQEKHSNQSESDFLQDPIETISEGAKVFSEKASEIFSTFLRKSRKLLNRPLRRVVISMKRFP
jgi:hypothetical protein